MCPNISRGSSGHCAHQHLNPIENAWALVAKQASLRQPKTLEELKHAVRGAWTEVMTEEYCTTLADSMDARLWKLRRCVVLTLATSYGQLVTITRLRIAVLGQKQHLAK